MIARRWTLATLALLCALTGGLLFGSVTTFAARGHAFGSSFGGKGSGNGQFEEPSGVAVSEASGDVYVVDKGNNRVEYFSASGTYLGQFNGSGLLFGEGKAAGSGGLATEIPTGQFSSPEGIAIDNSCQLHKPVLTEATTPTCAEFDPSNGDVYVADTNNKVVDKFSATGEYVGQLTRTPSGVFEEKLLGIAVDANGRVFVEKRGPGDLQAGDAAEFDNSIGNAFVADKELSEVEGYTYSGPGFAVDLQDEFYTLGSYFDGRFFLNKERADGHTLFDTLDEEQPTGLAVDLFSNELYVDHLGVVTRFSANLAPGDAPLERFGAGHLVSGSGVGIGPKGQTVYVADSTADVVDMFVPEPPSKPTLGSSSVSGVTAESATVQAELNPRGASTEYHLEYGRCATPSTCASSAYEANAPVPDASAGASFEIESIEVHAQGLKASTAYHAQIVAGNEFGSVEGEEQTFTTQAGGSAGVTLADGRQWELVSPPNKHGARIEPIYGAGTNPTLTVTRAGLTQAAESGGGIVYLTDIPTEAEPPANGFGFGGQVLSARGEQGWSTRDISTPHNAMTEANVAGDYQFFAGDLSSALAEPLGADATLLSSEASEPTPYIRTEALCDAPATAGGCYRPVLTDKEGFADVPSGTQFGTSGSNRAGRLPPVTFAGASPDLRHVLLRSVGVALTKTPVSQQYPPQEEVYEWSADAPASEALQMVSVLPPGEGGGPAPVGTGTLGGILVGGGRLYSEDNTQGAKHAISNDGSRIFWQVGNTASSQRTLYMRDTVKGETLRVDVPQPGVPAPVQPPEAQFEVASADGSKVFFTDTQKLTSDSGAELTSGSTSGSQRRNDLYECDIVEEAGKLACRLTDLTPASSGNPYAEVIAVFGAGEDASHLYFLANGVVNDSKNARGESATPAGTCSVEKLKEQHSTQTCDLYEYHDGAVTFIANVSRLRAYAGLMAYTSPDGRYLAFTSVKSPTGYDNRDVVSGASDSEVYLYDAVTGRLTCASCSPTGARPTGSSRLPLTPSVKEDGEPHDNERYQPRAVSDGGQVFFNSADALVSQDVNSNEDVYEFEPEGAGSCTSESTTFNAKSDGCLSLISSGTSPEPSGFLDASVSGNDVFFLTSAQLTAQDRDDLGDVYDAHVCTSASPCVTQPAPAPPCNSGDACKGTPAPQPSIFGEPASATFSGAGNLTPPPAVKKTTKKAAKCARGKARNRHGKCVKKMSKKKAKAKRSARKSTNAKGSN